MAIIVPISATVHESFISIYNVILSDPINVPFSFRLHLSGSVFLPSKVIQIYVLDVSSLTRMPTWFLCFLLTFTPPQKMPWIHRFNFVSPLCGRHYVSPQ